MRYYGKIGYSITEETKPGIWKERMEYRTYSGDVIRSNSKWISKEKVNEDIDISNQISVLADPYAYENFQHMKTVEFMGAEWKISSIEVQRPRIILTVGGLYNGQ